MSKFVPKYSQKLVPQDFIRFFTRCCKEISGNGISEEKKEVFENLIRNYKSFHEEYNRDSVLVNSVAYWTKKLKFTDMALWKILEDTVRQRFQHYDGEILINIAKLFSEDKELIKKFEEHILKNLGKFKSKQLSEFASIRKSNDFIVNLFYSSNLIVNNELDLLYFIKECNDNAILHTLEGYFRILLPKSVNTQGLCAILYEFNNKNYELEDQSIALLEATIQNNPLLFNLKDAHHFLIIFNHPHMYGRFTPTFWQAFTTKIGEFMDNWSAAMTLSYFSQEGFFVQPLFEKAISAWQVEVENHLDPKVFREGFYGLCHSKFVNSEIIAWSLEKFGQIKGFDNFDILHLARALTIQGIYLDGFWLPLISKLRLMSIVSLAPKSKPLLYHIYKSLQIDAPPNLHSALSQLQHLHQETFASYKKVVTFTRSYSQQYVARVLSLYNYDFLENQYIDDIYEVDLLLTKQKICIEVIGNPYHVSQITHDIYPKLQMKTRHLNKLGWKVILVSEKETAQMTLQKAISLFEIIDSPLTVKLQGGEIKII